MPRNKESARIQTLLERERRLWNDGVAMVAGVDEAGRGPLAGPVVAAAVIFPHDIALAGIDDSKKLSATARDDLFDAIYANAIAIGVGVIDCEAIDRVNILNATFGAMHSAIQSLSVTPRHLLIDGNKFFHEFIPFTTIVDGDARCYSIAAASIIAKVTRDRLMCAFAAEYPEYGFEQHKGYGTKMHYAALRTYGLCPIHRRSFIHLETDLVPNEHA